MPRKPKTDLIRAVLQFNPTVYGRAGSPQEFDRLKAKIADYDAQDGGSWNYDNLYEVVRKYLKGLHKSQSESAIQLMTGKGEAKAKQALFAGLVEKLKLADATYLEVGPVEIAMKGGKKFSISPDFGYRRGGINYHVLVYPNKEPPLKAKHREVLVAAFTQPIPLTTESYKFCLVEFPQIGDKRQCNVEVHDFGYRSVDDEFTEHFSMFVDLLERGSQQGELF